MVARIVGLVPLSSIWFCVKLWIVPLALNVFVVVAHIPVVVVVVADAVDIVNKKQRLS